MAEPNEREMELAAAFDAEYTRESERAETLEEAQQRCTALFARALAEYREELGAAPAAPIPMLLWCPECRMRHIDVGEFATKPHHTHSCQHCGMTWRPAVVPTTGVAFLPGCKNEATATRSLMDAVETLLRDVGAFEIRLNDGWMVEHMPSNAPAPVTIAFDDGMEDDRHACDAEMLAKTLGSAFAGVESIRARLAAGDARNLHDLHDCKKVLDE